jgi:hypothetical protein
MTKIRAALARHSSSLARKRARYVSADAATRAADPVSSSSNTHPGIDGLHANPRDCIDYCGASCICELASNVPTKSVEEGQSNCSLAAAGLASGGSGSPSAADRNLSDTTNDVLQVGISTGDEALRLVSITANSSVAFKRVAHGHGSGYALMVGPDWIATLHGADGTEMLSTFLETPAEHQGTFLRGVTLGLLARDKTCFCRLGISAARSGRTNN